MVRTSTRHLKRSTRRVAARSSVAVWLTKYWLPCESMAGILAASAGIGWGCSILLQCCGLTLMCVRYPLATAVSYATFLVLIGFYVRHAARRLKTQLERLRWDAARRQFRRNDYQEPQLLGDFVGECLETSEGEDADAEGAAGVIIAFLGLSVVLICLFAIITAPLFLATVLIEGAMLNDFYRPTTRGPDSTWLSVAIEETILPAAMVVLSLTLLGVAIQLAVPEATNIVDVWESLRS